MLLRYNQEMYRSMQPMQPGKHFLFQQKVFFAVAKQGKIYGNTKFHNVVRQLGFMNFILEILARSTEAFFSAILKLTASTNLALSNSPLDLNIKV